MHDTCHGHDTPAAQVGWHVSLARAEQNRTERRCMGEDALCGPRSCMSAGGGMSMSARCWRSANPGAVSWLAMALACRLAGAVAQAQCSSDGEAWSQLTV